MKLARLFVHPLKSGAPLEVTRWPLDALGLIHDRRLMLVDPNGAFVTLRALPRMVTLRPRPLSPDDRRITFDPPEGSDLAPLVIEPHPSPELLPVQVWGDWVDAPRVGSEADAWFSAALGTRVHLVRFPEDVLRQVDRRFAAAGTGVGFADGFPLLVIGSASLDDLSARLGARVEAERFRPNLVIATEVPYVEDTWRKVRVGDLELDLVKPCARCVGINVDPATGRAGTEPLKTLATHRRRDREVYFGHNALHRGLGVLEVGASVTVLERH